MAYPKPEVGLVLGYNYLWHFEESQGHAEGFKNRPCGYFTHLKGKPTGISFVNSTSLKVCHKLRIPRHKVFEGIAALVSQYSSL